MSARSAPFARNLFFPNSSPGGSSILPAVALFWPAKTVVVLVTTHSLLGVLTNAAQSTRTASIGVCATAVSQLAATTARMVIIFIRSPPGENWRLRNLLSQAKMHRGLRNGGY